MVNVVDTFKADADLVLETYFKQYAEDRSIDDDKVQMSDANVLLAYSLSSDIVEFIKGAGVTSEQTYDRIDVILQYGHQTELDEAVFDKTEDDDLEHLLGIGNSDVLLAALSAYHPTLLKNNMSVDEVVMYAGYCSWVFGRRGADINGAWTYDSNYFYGSVPGAINSGFSFLKLLVSYSDLNDSRKQVMFNQADADDLKKKENEIKLGTTNNLIMTGKFKYDHIGPVGLSAAFNADETMDLYNYKATYTFDSKRSISVEGQAIADDMHTDLYKRLTSKLQDSRDKNFNNWLKLASTGFEDTTQWGLTLTNVIKSFKDADKKKEVAGFNRMSDTTGTVPTLENGAFSYVKAGFTINMDDDNQGKTTQITDEPLTSA